MNSRLKVVLILLAGTAIGAGVAGGAILYVNASGTPSVSARAPSYAVDSRRGTETPTEEVPEEQVAPTLPINRPLTGGRNSDGDVPLYGSNGPSASVTTDPQNAPPPSPPVRKAAPKPGPVIEEEAEPPKISDDEGSKDGDGGSVR